MKKNLKVIVFYAALILIIIFAATSLFKDTYEEAKVYSDIVEYFSGEQVHQFVVDENNQLTLELYTDKPESYKYVTYKLRDLSIFYNDLNELILEQKAEGIIADYDYTAAKEIPFWVSILPYIIMGVLFILLWVFMMNQASGRGGKMNSFGRAKVKTVSADKKKVFFDDVAGADEEKEELKEIVEFLKNPAKFQKLGAKIPHGVLLMGPPGTGKTLLAKAVAGEAGVPFYSISGSDFVEMYVGVGASRVRDLFETAKRSPASIIFIDEIDAVGRHRGAGLGGGHDEREQTLNQLLVEMDGFETGDGVIVIAATNRPDILDPALLRPGRFDRQVTVNYPDVTGRRAILDVHAKNKPFEETVDFDTIAKTTVGFTGADLANLLNEAALLAARRGKTLIGMEDIEDAVIKVIVGPKKKSKIITEKERKLTAYHEAGHAIVTKLLAENEAVHQISIIPSGGAGGYTLSLPKEDRSYRTKQAMENEIAILLGGRVAESLIMDDISTGASNDIQRATTIARDMVMKYGMSDLLGSILYGSGHSESEVFLGRDFNNTRNYSEETASDIDKEIKRIIRDAFEKAKKILEDHMGKLHFAAEFLMKHEIMDEAQFEALMSGDPTMEELEQMQTDKKRRSEEENAARASFLEEERKAEEARRREEEARRRMEDFDFPKD